MIVSLPDRDISLAEARQLLLDVGVPMDFVLIRIADACAWDRVIATGFGHAHHGVEHASSDQRKRIPHHIWRVLSAVEPSNPNFSEAQKEAFDAFASWDRSSITVRIVETGLEHTWDGVSFDRTTFSAFLSAQRLAHSRRHSDSDIDVQQWIGDHQGRNSQQAWKAYRTDRGHRAAKKTTFFDLWRAATGGRGRGRPRKG